MPRTISFGGISSVGVSSYTVPTGQQRLLVAWVFQSRGVPVPPPSVITDLSFGGVAMTLAAQFAAYQTGANEQYFQCWYLYNPPMGSSQNFTSVSGGGTQTVEYAAYYNNAISIFNVFQSTGGQQSGSPGNTSLFSNNNFQTNAWGLTLAFNGSGTTISSPTFAPTNRANNGSSYWTDTNGTFSGIYEWDYTLPANQVYGFMALFIIPYSDPVVADTVVISEFVQLGLNPVLINVFDAVTITEAVGMENTGNVRIPSTLVTSGYKWLTQTLYNAQQQFNVRPWFTAQVIDDTIQPQAELFSGTGSPLGNGSMAVGPDGTAFAVGLDGSGNLAVWSDTNLNAVAGVWRNKQILDTSLSPNYNNIKNQYSIAISEYISGTYVIDIFYFHNFANDGTNLKIRHQQSTNGGLTWTSLSWITTSYVNNALGNVSIAAWQPQWVNGSVVSNCFFIQPNTGTFNSGFTGYDVYYGLGPYIWTQNANSYDWSINGIAAAYFNGIQYCVVSGFRNIIDMPGPNENYSLWITGLLNETGANDVDLWTAPVPILLIGSSSAINQGTFAFPTATVQNGNIYVTVQANLVDSVSQTSTANGGGTVNLVTLHTNYMLFVSNDAKGWSYPTVFVGPDGTEFNSAAPASFVLQNGYWYLGGGLGWLWEYVQNAIVADVSGDIIGYEISEGAGQPSALTLQIANANGKWVGANPTGQGAAALAGGRKMSVWQGYYNANGVPEAVPHAFHFIDDVTQTVNSTQNDVSLVGRDWYKNLIVTITKYAYQFVGPLFFSDIFDGTFSNSWNQLSGTWEFDTSTNPPFLNLSSGSLSSAESDIMYAGNNANCYGSIMRLFFESAADLSTNSHLYVYAMYIDSENWLRLDINTYSSTWTVTKSIAGATTNLDSGSLPTALINNTFIPYGIFVRQYSYYKFNFMIDMYGVASPSNEIFDYVPTTTSYVFKNSGTGEYDMTSAVASNVSLQQPFTVGIGSYNGGPAIFRFFMYSQFTSVNSVGTLVRRISRIAGVMAFKLTYTFRELLFTPFFTGTNFYVQNRKLYIGGGGIVSAPTTFSNGQISFMAKMSPVNASNPCGFTFRFRDELDESGFADNYQLHVIQASTGFANPPSFCRFERYVQDIGQTAIFYNSPYDVSNNQATVAGAGVNLDLTKWHKFDVYMINGWFYAFIDDVMVASWNDNNTSIAYQTNGVWGFGADANTNLQVKSITAPDFWKPVQSFTVNPGDDMESDIQSIIQQLRAWFFTDMLGRFKMRLLNSTDPSTYTYDQQLQQQGVDNSDKEWVSQVTVWGTGVSATARATNLMAGVLTRDMTIVDYTITTQQDAQTRANNELTTANQNLNQFSPVQIVNVGAELFDSVTVINTGNNTAGTDGGTRVYSQTFTEGGGNNNSDYSITLDTGNL